jgi:hypothetical protein
LIDKENFFTDRNVTLGRERVGKFQNSLWTYIAPDLFISKVKKIRLSIVKACYQCSAEVCKNGKTIFRVYSVMSVKNAAVYKGATSMSVGNSNMRNTTSKQQWFEIPFWDIFGKIAFAKYAQFY